MRNNARIGEVKRERLRNTFFVIGVKHIKVLILHKNKRGYKSKICSSDHSKRFCFSFTVWT